MKNNIKKVPEIFDPIRRTDDGDMPWILKKYSFFGYVFYIKHYLKISEIRRDGSIIVDLTDYDVKKNAIRIRDHNLVDYVYCTNAVCYGRAQKINWQNRPAEKLVPLDEELVAKKLYLTLAGDAISWDKEIEDIKNYWRTGAKALCQRFGSVPVVPQVEWPPEKKCKHGSLCGPNGDCEGCYYNRGRVEAMAAFDEAVKKGS